MTLYEAIKEWLLQHPELKWGCGSYDSSDDSPTALHCDECTQWIATINSDHVLTNDPSLHSIKLHPSDPEFFTKLRNAHSLCLCEWAKANTSGPDYYLAS